MKILDNLYAYLWPGVTLEEMESYGNNCNSYLIADSFSSSGKVCHTLIDPGHVANELGQDCIGNLLQEMKKDGIKAEDIGLVIGTHSHPDHYEASQFIKDKSQALIALSKEEQGYLEKVGQKIYQMFGARVPASADICLEEGELELHKIKLEVIYTPGHSPGAISLYWRDSKVLIAGDVIFYGNTGRVDIPGGSGQVLQESIEKLSKLDVDYVLTGHQYGSPGIIAGKENIRKNFDFVRKHVFPYL